jgi:hypothetical protein
VGGLDVGKWVAHVGLVWSPDRTQAADCEYPAGVRVRTLADRMTTAHHEASHAVVAVLTGATVTSAVLLDERPWGRVKSYRDVPDGLDPPDRDEIRPEVAQTLAGPIGELIVKGGRWAELAMPSYLQIVAVKRRLAAGPDPGRHDDIARAAEAVRLLVLDQADLEDYLQDCAALAEKLVRLHWAMIEGVAAELTEHGQVSGDRLLAIMGQRSSAGAADSIWGAHRGA